MIQEKSTRELILELKNRILDGGKISFDEAKTLMAIAADQKEIFELLLASAGEIQRTLRGTRLEPCSLLNAKSGACAEDCGFCAQSVFYIQTETQQYPLMPVETMLKTAMDAKARGAERFCLVTSGMSLTDKDFESIEKTAGHIVNNLQIACDICVGFLTRERIQRLKKAGVRRVNINLQSSEQFYPSIVTTHSWQDRLDNLKLLKEEGMELCSGGIIGMGESTEDRLGLAFVLAELEAEVVPINILDSRRGTKLEDKKKLPVFEILKSVAVFRFILPKSELKIAGGREANLEYEEQVKALQCGGDGLITGGYLTTSGNSFEKDMTLIKEAGFQWGNRE